ncbi:MAG: serine/threonine protein kinase, partial [Planctomycetaceae bacterium]
MSPSDPHLPESREERLEQVLAEYLNAVESGQAVEPADLIARHPDLADDLRSFFRNRLEIDRLAQPLRHPADAATLLGQPGAGSASADPMVRYFGDYEVLSEIARGGMGVVYKARQRNLNRIVALKMILAGHLANDSDVKRFYAEAEAAAALDHPGIVPIFEIGQHEGQHYFSMAFIEGESLARRVAEGPIPPREAAELVRKVSEAVDYAHQKGIIHRDLKPGNVLLDQTGQPRVTDFGLAKQLAADSGLTGTGQILGTPSYMPPEQAAGKMDAVSPASDVYSLGAILYCLITGRPPFQAASPLETLQQVLSQEPAPSRQLNAQV